MHQIIENKEFIRRKITIELTIVQDHQQSRRTWLPARAEGQRHRALLDSYETNRILRFVHH